MLLTGCPATVLLVGGTGRTGRRVLERLLGRGVGVRVFVRSRRRLPTGAAGSPNLAVVEADLLSVRDDELRSLLRGCDAVISCLGHVTDLAGVFGPPRDLVLRATTRLCRGIEALRPANVVKFVLMSSVSVDHPGRLETGRGTFDRMIVWMLRGLLPPARDNQRTADFLWRDIGTAHPFVEWATVRPDTLREGDVTEYTVHEGLVSGLFAPESTRIANVAHFMCELVANPKAWNEWKGKLPVIVDAPRRGVDSRVGGVPSGSI